MYYKGCIIKDGKIPMSDYSLTEEGLENILKHQDIPFVNAIYEKLLRLNLFVTEMIYLPLLHLIDQRIQKL